MNWLDPQDVERWLAENRGKWVNDGETTEALEQFVRALAGETETCERYSSQTVYNCPCRLCERRRVARLLVKAMEGE